MHSINCYTITYYTIHVISQVGGNQNAREFLDAQSDYDDAMSIQQKYNTKAAALYRDKVATLAAGKPWSAATSAAQKHVAPSVQASSSTSYASLQQSGGGVGQFQGGGGGGAGYQQDGAGYQNLVNTAEFKAEKQQYFNKVQEQNAQRPE